MYSIKWWIFLFFFSYFFFFLSCSFPVFQLRNGSRVTVLSLQFHHFTFPFHSITLYSIFVHSQIHFVCPSFKYIPNSFLILTLFPSLLSLISQLPIIFLFFYILFCSNQLQSIHCISKDTYILPTTITTTTPTTIPRPPPPPPTPSQIYI